jgi:hypothetical protein
MAQWRFFVPRRGEGGDFSGIIVDGLGTHAIQRHLVLAFSGKSPSSCAAAAVVA